MSTVLDEPQMDTDLEIDVDINFHNEESAELFASLIKQRLLALRREERRLAEAQTFRRMLNTLEIRDRVRDWLRSR